MSRTYVQPQRGEDWLGLLKRCDGYYKCPKDADGKRLGPLVGYAGKYTAADGKKYQWVGDEYANFAKIECRGNVLKSVAIALADEVRQEFDFDGFCSMPMGGLKLAGVMAALFGYDDIYPEKEITKVKTADSREESRLIFDRHEPQEGEDYILVEDVCNNFSTTASGIELIESYGARVLGIACFLNRSPMHQEYFRYKDRNLRILALVSRTISEYTQHDPFVAADIAAGNVCWKPKKRDQWPVLMEAMAKHAKAA